jgi:preprotein translocase subunit SecG
MLGFVIGVLSVAIVLLCGWILLLILMQRPSANAGMGASLGGGMAESAFGGEASNVLTRWTVYGIAAFFTGTLCLSLMHITKTKSRVVYRELTPIAVEHGSPANTSTSEDEKKSEEDSIHPTPPNVRESSPEVPDKSPNA